MSCLPKATRWHQQVTCLPEGHSQEEFYSRTKPSGLQPPTAELAAGRERQSVLGVKDRFLGAGKLELGGSTPGRPLSECPGSLLDN